MSALPDISRGLPFDVVWGAYTFPEYIQPFPLQIETVNELALNNTAGYWLDMGCVDAATEYLSPTGWVRIADYDGGMVGQWVPDAPRSSTGRLEFVDPQAYIKKPCDEMVRFKTSRGVDQLLSKDHRVLYAIYNGRTKECTAQAVADQHGSLTYGWKGRFITTFSFSGGAGLDCSDADLRLMVALIADGHFPNGTNRCVIRVKKGRKIERLRDLLRGAGKPWREVKDHGVGCEGFIRFSFQAPWRTKEFGPEFYRATAKQLGVIVDEVPHWDGSVSDDSPFRGWSFYTSVRASADFVQFAMAACGIRATLAYNLRQRDDRKDSHEYRVQAFARSNLAYLTGVSPDEETGEPVRAENIWYEKPADGMQYCFTVPSSYLVLRRNGCIFVTGNCGKTFCSTVSALYLKLLYGNQTVVIMPPLLITQWKKWLLSIKPALTLTAYRGTPKEREKLSLDADVVLVGLQVFKKDYHRFIEHFEDREYTVICDEANFMSNPETDNHRTVAKFAAGKPTMLLTGTPANKPLDAYGLIKITNPGCYRNIRHFENMHVEERDFFEKPTKWGNLDLLAQNLMVNSKRILYEDVFRDIEEPQFVPLEYELDKAHYKLYTKLADEQLLALPDGGKIDATSVNKLTHALGQIVVNHGHFAGDPSLPSNAVDLVKDKLDELGDGKLVVFANYKMSVRALIDGLKKYGAVGINSEVSPSQKDRNLAAFVNDPACRVIVIQFVSGGKGLDGLQHVCNHCLFIEPCQQPRDFHQAVARLKRTGQRKRVWVGLAIASKTLQVRGFDALLANDTLVNQVVRNATSLKRAIYGE